jgi:hypothetical protein
VRGSAARVALPALVLLGLAVVVVVSAGGRTPSGTDASRPVPDVFFDSLISVGLVLLIPGAIAWIWALSQRKAIQSEIRKGKIRRVGIMGWVVFTLLFALLTWYRGRNWQPPTSEDELGEQPFPGGGTPTTPEAPGATTYEPEFAWLPALAIAVLALLAVGAFLVSTRRRTAASGPEALVEAVAEILDDTVDDLRAEADPRRAVIAAYARLEQAFAVSGLPRRRTETAQEYVSRALRALEVREGSANRLTALYEVAKFSDHDVDAGMKDEAIAALVDVRAELRRAAVQDEPEPRVETSLA